MGILLNKTVTLRVSNMSLRACFSESRKSGFNFLFLSFSVLEVCLALHSLRVP